MMDAITNLKGQEQMPRANDFIPYDRPSRRVFKQMKAKYPSMCRICKLAIEIDDWIEWTQGRGCIHLNCGTQPMTIRYVKPEAPRPSGSGNISQFLFTRC